jgi:hypothetical protein
MRHALTEGRYFVHANLSLRRLKRSISDIGRIWNVHEENLLRIGTRKSGFL